MMVSPEFFKDENKNKSLKELITTKNELINEINECENILNNEAIMSEIAFSKPGPKVRYEMNMLYLKEIIDLIIEKKNEF